MPRLHLAAARLAAFLVIASASAAPRADDLPPSLDAITSAAGQCHRHRLRHDDCRAILTIDRAMSIQLDAERTTVGLARPIPADRDRIAERRWNRLLATRVDPASLCRAASGIAGRYPEPDGGGDGFVASTLVELAFRLDRRDQTDCLPSLLSRMRPVPPVDALIATEHEFCTKTWRFGSACDAIARR